MSRAPLRLAGWMSPRLASAILLVSSLLVACAATTFSEELLFFRATQDSEQYAKDPQRYNRVSLAPPDSMIYYVERQPALRIPLSAVRSVELEKAKVYTNLQEGLLEALRLRDKGPDEPSAQYYYWATFALSAQAGRQVTTLSQRFPGDPFELKLGAQRLSIGSFTPPRPGAGNTFNPFGVPLMERDRQRLEEIFLPLKDRLSWK